MSANALIVKHLANGRRHATPQLLAEKAAELAAVEEEIQSIKEALGG